MKKKISAVLFACLLSVSCITAFSACDDGSEKRILDTRWRLEYRLNPDGVSYSVVGKGIAMESELIIPSSYNGFPVTVIDELSFGGYDFVNITVPQSIEKIGSQAFFNCRLLESINIPENVAYIGMGAFDNCESLTEIILSEGVESIEKHTFSYCCALRRISLPHSLKNIGTSAFRQCFSLADINYNGTKNEWLAIDKERGWDEMAANYTVHCTDGDIVKNSRPQT